MPEAARGRGPAGASAAARASMSMTTGQGISSKASPGSGAPSLGYGEERLVEAAARQMRKLPYYHIFAPQGRTTPAIELAEKLVSIAPVPMSQGLLRQLRLRGQRHRRQDGLVLQQRARPAAEEEDHRAAARLSRRHRRRGQPDRACPATTAISICRSPTSCTPTARTTTASASRARARRSSPAGWPTSSRR